MSYRFHPAAEAEHFETIEFFESRGQGLGMAYVLEFERAMDRIVEAPHRYRIERKPNIRRLSLVRFPLKVIFRELSGSVQVLAYPTSAAAQATGQAGSNNRFQGKFPIPHSSTSFRIEPLLELTRVRRDFYRGMAPRQPIRLRLITRLST